MLETHALGDVVVIDLERRRQRGIQDLDVVREDLDLTADQPGVDRAFRARADPPGNADDVFVAQLLGGSKCLGAVRITYHLNQALAVAQVDEDDAAVVATPVHPAADSDGLAKSFAVDEAAIVGAFQCSLRKDGGAALRRRRLVEGRWVVSGRTLRTRRANAARRDPVLPGQFRWSSAGVEARATGATPGECSLGATTPIEMMYLSASSTVMSSSCTRVTGSITK